MEEDLGHSRSQLISAIEALPGGKASLDLHFLRSPNPKVFFVFVEKVACTSVKQALFTASFGNLYDLDPDYFFEGWKHHDLLHAFSHETFLVDGREVLASKDSKIITFCRNPYTRFVSAFANRVADPREPDSAFAQWTRREVLFNGARNGRFSHSISMLSKGIGLGDFARYVQDSPVNTHDVHWMSQHLINLAGKIDPISIVRFENFQDEFRAAWEEHVGTPFPILKRQERNRSTRSAYSYDRNTAAMVRDIYKEDFEIFGYDTDSWAD